MVLVELPQDISDPKALLPALDSFLGQNAATTTFISDSTTLSSKQELVKSLINGIDSHMESWGAEVTSKVLMVLRILLREAAGCEQLYTEKGAGLLAKLSQLRSTGPYQATPTSTEALKCICNIIVNKPECRLAFQSQGGAQRIVEILRESKPSVPMEPTFLFLRILFLLTAHDKSVTTDLTLTYDLPALLAEILEPLARNPDLDSMSNLVVCEVLKIVFNVMMAFENPTKKGPLAALKPNAPGKGPAGSNESLAFDDSHKFDGLVTSILTILRTFPISEPPLKPPISHAIHALLNIPIAPYRSIWFPNDDVSTVKRLISILEDTLNSVLTGHDSDDVETVKLQMGAAPLDEVLPPLLLLLTALARADSGAKALMKKQITPEDIDRAHDLTKGSSLPARLIRFMTSISMINIRNSASELLFALCDDKPDALVSYVGYGNAAGYLYNNGLLPAASSGGQGIPEGVNPITGELERQQAEDEWNKMTDEEKELEAEKLFVLFDRLNKTG
ncbi:guanine nucleotide exchange factor, partial [Phlyctochytrium arcticum]